MGASRADRSLELHINTSYYLQRLHLSNTILLRGGMNSSYSWDHGIHATYITAPADLVISTLSPVFSPRVLYDPVRLFLKPDRWKTSRPVPHQKHPMIQTPPADIWAGNSFHVCLHESCIDANCTMQAKEPSFHLDSLYIIHS